MVEPTNWAEDRLSELDHHGVKGMKWGVRKDRNAPNPDYTKQQRKRDVQAYGKRGSKKINRRMNQGDKISVARGYEKNRRDKVTGKSKYVRQVGKLGGGATGAAIGHFGQKAITDALASRQGIMFLNRTIGANNALAARQAWSTVQDIPAARYAIDAGAAKVGYMLSGDIAVKTHLKAHGYNPNRKY